MSTTRLIEHFSQIEDPRIMKKCDHRLIDILVMTVCASICRFDESWEAIEEFAHEREDWFKKFLELPNGIPSHDTFRRVFLLLDPKELHLCFIGWANALRKNLNDSKGKDNSEDDTVGLDGKTLCGSCDGEVRKRGIHVVSAWSSMNSLVLGQLKVDEKSNEITAIPDLLKLLELKGCTVTIDAMGTQKAIVEVIVAKKADYVLGLKGNQPELYEAAKTYIDDQLKDKITDKTYQTTQTTDADHGRIETRTFHLFNNLSWLTQAPDWKGLIGIGAIDSSREKNGKITQERRYFITSLKDIEKFARSTRAHWGIENSLHWVLDVAFDEDRLTQRKGNAPENSNVIRHMVLNLLRAEKSRKISINRKRGMACLRLDYLEKVVFG